MAGTYAAEIGATTLISLLRTARLDLSSEKKAQADFETLLIREGIPHDREVKLGGADIVDFLVGGIAVELKLRARKMAVYRQLRRYAASPRVGSLILASNTSMGLPPSIEGKDAYFAKLGEGWL